MTKKIKKIYIHFGFLFIKIFVYLFNKNEELEFRN